MTGLVERLQRDSLDETVSVSNLLRSTKLAAAKLKLSRVEDWVNSELSGYKTNEVPDYRIIYGIPKAFNPYQGWIPMMGDHRIIDTISKKRIYQSIPEIEHLIANSGDGGFLEAPYSPQETEQLHRIFQCPPFKVSLHINCIQMVAIVEKVRDQVLNWAMELEKKGILGEGLGFNMNEKKIAQEGMTLNFGHVGSIIGNIGSNNTIETISVNEISTEETKKISGLSL